MNKTNWAWILIVISLTFMSHQVGYMKGYDARTANAGYDSYERINNRAFKNVQETGKRKIGAYCEVNDDGPNHSDYCDRVALGKLLNQVLEIADRLPPEDFRAISDKYKSTKVGTHLGKRTVKTVEVYREPTPEEILEAVKGKTIEELYNLTQ